jgi:glycosyltransferase involved in cell wall biosynthesis
VRTDSDPERIAERIDELLDAPRRRECLAENGREHVTANYDRKMIARRLSTELTRLAASETGG